MDAAFHAALTALTSPTLGFLLGGMALAALGSKLRIPVPTSALIAALLLLKIGMGAGMAIREAGLLSLALPALGAMVLGVAIVGLGGLLLVGRRGLHPADAYATAGLFGAVSASTLAAGMAALDHAGVAYEGTIAALYPFMDLPALLAAILLGRVAHQRAQRDAAMASPSITGAVPSTAAAGDTDTHLPHLMRGIFVDTLRSAPISALLLGLALGAFVRIDAPYTAFYDALFPGLLSLLMLVMGMEAWQRLGDLRRVAHLYVAYGLLAPFLHGAMGLAVGLALHHLAGFSPGGVVLLAVMAASSSDISGPPTLRAALPQANPSAYVGTSTGIGTPVAILSIPLWMALVDSILGL